MFESQRKKASFDQLKLSHLIYGGKDNFDSFVHMQKVISNDPVLKFDPSFLHQSRADMMTAYAKKMLKFHSFYPLDGSNESDKLNFFTHATPLSLHGLMFMTTLKNLCDKQQEKLFLEPAIKGQILGCYAQTQLAHGSDVQNLLTTATYDQGTESFVINTPQIGATKWWIGDLGLYCTHAAVFAQLYINGKKYGVHAFLVPIRNKQTLATLPGIEAGDIGPKMAFQNKDNGYAIFSNVKIPRRNMLMKYHAVSKEGVYSLKGDQKISYATMLLTRSGMISAMTNSGVKTAAIATRYSILRTQFKDKQGKEIPVFNYLTQQEKIIPRIAEVFAGILISNMIKDLSNFVFEESKKGNFQRLNEAHILTSGIKAIISLDTLKGCQILRRSAGGHGFHSYNGLGPIQMETTPTYTLEGQYTVLLLQVSRYLLKAAQRLQRGKPLDESVKYIQHIAKGDYSVQIPNQQSLKCPHIVSDILMLHSCAKLRAASEKIAKKMGQQLTFKEIQDHHAGITLNDAAVAHCYYIMYSNFLKVVTSITDEPLKAVMTKLLILYGIQKIVERAGKFYQTSSLSPEAFSFIYKKRESLLAELRPQALSLIEAFGYEDTSLMSAMAASNQKPYENLIQWAEKYNSLNRKEERDQIIEAIKKAKSAIKPKL